MTTAFDSVASTYDADFTDTRLGRTMRQIVWDRLEAAFPPGSRVLELACGTGEDARRLAERGVHILATDQSEEMLAVARKKCAGLPVDFACLDLTKLVLRRWDLGVGSFDGAFSNFGGLNLLDDYRPVAAFLAALIRPGGMLMLVVMGRWCAWEILWHLGHLAPHTAFRRLPRGGAEVQVGASRLRVYYPKLSELRTTFEGSGFRWVQARPLGLLLPPSYLEPLTKQRWFPFDLFARWDRSLSWPLWGDHTIVELTRTS